MKGLASFLKVNYVYLLGLKTDADDILLSSRNNMLKKLGKYLQLKAREKRLTLLKEASYPLVSIILPCFNAEASIQKTLESVFKQSYKNWELLIINDGSTDKTLSKIDDLIQGHSNIKVFSNRINSGVAYSRNVGLYSATGEYMTFHDADDTSHKERLEYQLSELLADESIEIVVSQYVRVNANNEVFVINGSKKRNYISGMMFRKKVTSKIGYFKQTQISEDSEYHERILTTFGKKSRKIIYKILYYALYSPNSLLFSNANVEVTGNNINYKITDEQSAVLEGFRKEHRKIKEGFLSPYQEFAIDTEITSKHSS